MHGLEFILNSQTRKKKTLFLTIADFNKNKKCGKMSPGGIVVALLSKIQLTKAALYVKIEKTYIVRS